MKKLKLNLLIKSDLFNGLLKTYTCIEQENAGRCELDEMSGQEDWEEGLRDIKLKDYLIIKEYRPNKLKIKLLQLLIKKWRHFVTTLMFC